MPTEEGCLAQGLLPRPDPRLHPGYGDRPCRSGPAGPDATHFDFFEPYQAPCLECSWFSSDEGIRRANEEVGDFHRLWQAYQAQPAGQRPEWAGYIAGWEQAALAGARASPRYQPPDPGCAVCTGTGIATATYPVSGLRFEGRSMDDREWGKLGAVGAFEVSPDAFGILVTPDGQAHRRWGAGSPSSAEWEAFAQAIFARHPDCQAIKVLINLSSVLLRAQRP